MYIKMEDHRSEDGNIDWASYKKAQKENGEYCYKCGALIVLGRGGYRRSCYQCDELRNGSSVTHSQFTPTLKGWGLPSNLKPFPVQVEAYG